MNWEPPIRMICRFSLWVTVLSKAVNGVIFSVSYEFVSMQQFAMAW